MAGGRGEEEVGGWAGGWGEVGRVGVEGIQNIAIF